MMLRSRTVPEAPVAAPVPRLPANIGAATLTPLFLPGQIRAVAPRLPRRPSRRALSFVIVVLLPVALAGVYYLAIAANQYVAEFRMTLRTVDAPRIDPLLFFGGDATHTTAVTEAQIVTQFIASRAIVDELDPKLDLRRLFSPREADWSARLPLPASAEQLVYYWQNQVDPFYDISTGTIVVRVRAFSPNEALRLAQAIVASSETLVNDLSARARRDALGYAETEVKNAETRLKTALTAIREFRDREGMIDPGKTADANATLMTKLRGDLLKANAQLATLKAFVREDTPTIRLLKARIRSLEAEQHDLAHEVTASTASTATPSAAPALSQELSSYEALEAERKFAEAAYQHGLEGPRPRAR